MDALISVAFNLVGVIFLVLLNGFFVAAEFALVKIRDTQLETLVLKGHRRAKVARRIVQNLDAALSATQLGITLASLGLGWVGKPVFASLLEPVFRYFEVDPKQANWLAFVIGFTVITFLHIVVGELAPKSLAIQKPLLTSLWVAQPLHWFYKVFFPVIWVLNHAAFWILRRCGLQPVNEAELIHSEEELRLLIGVSQRHSGGTRLGRNIVLNALDLKDRIVREVMRPRQEIVGLDTDADIATCLETADKTRYSRFPLCEGGDLDKTVGVVHIKDLYSMRNTARSGSDLASTARRIIYVPETARLEKLLQLFLDRKLHLAIVVDEYGGTVGMVTLENILEELVGQIQDEFDQEKPLLVKTGPQTWDVAGNLSLHELSGLVMEPLQEENITTVSGWVTHKLGGFPKSGDVLPLNQGTYELRVEEMEGMRVAKLKLTRLATGEESKSKE